MTTEAAADDISAYQAGTFLARNLAAGMATQEAFERSRPGQHALYYLFSAHDCSEDAEAQTIKLMHDGFRRQEALIQAVQQNILDEFAALERRVLVVESATTVLERRSTPTIDRIMILLMAGIMLAMFAHNVMAGFTP